MQLLEIDGLFKVSLGSSFIFREAKSMMQMSKGAANSYAVQSGSTIPLIENLSSDQKLDLNNLDEVTNGEQYFINTFVMKIFSLLFCRGSSVEKTQILFDAILGPNGIKIEKGQVSWRNTRMFKAFRHLVYFSDVFPVKYWKKFMEPKVVEEK